MSILFFIISFGDIESVKYKILKIPFYIFFTFGVSKVSLTLVTLAGMELWTSYT